MGLVSTLRINNMKLFPHFVYALALGVLPVVAGAQDGAFTAAQAAAGRTSYLVNCVGCHLADLRGSNEARPLTGGDFMNTWRERSTGQLAAFIEDYERNALVETRPFPAVTETLDALRDAGFTLAVVTNKPENATHIVLDALGIDGYFATVAGGDSFPVRKPHPGHLLGEAGDQEVDVDRVSTELAHRDLIAP